MPFFDVLLEVMAVLAPVPLLAAFAAGGAVVVLFPAGAVLFPAVLAGVFDSVFDVAFDMFDIVFEAIFDIVFEVVFALLAVELLVVFVAVPPQPNANNADAITVIINLFFIYFLAAARVRDFVGMFSLVLSRVPLSGTRVLRS